MKTAISIPDDVFEGAERTASALGLSRSELYATAVREFVERYRSADVTERLDRIYGEDDSLSRLDERLQTLQTYSLGRDDVEVKRGEVWWADLPEARRARSRAIAAPCSSYRRTTSIEAG